LSSEPITPQRVEETVEIHLPSMTKHLHAIRTLCITLAESMGFGRKDSEATALAVEEALTNVIEHAYHGEAGKKVQVIFEMEGNKFTVRIIHGGDQIDASQYVMVDDLDHFYKQKKRGGLGILIMKRCMDEVTYKRGPDQNECCMIKYLRKQ
jgi:serine/threonine-protein kinase RsbW